MTLRVGWIRVRCEGPPPCSSTAASISASMTFSASYRHFRHELEQLGQSSPLAPVPLRPRPGQLRQRHPRQLGPAPLRHPNGHHGRERHGSNSTSPLAQLRAGTLELPVIGTPVIVRHIGYFNELVRRRRVGWSAGRTWGELNIDLPGFSRRKFLSKYSLQREYGRRPVPSTSAMATCSPTPWISEGANSERRRGRDSVV